MDNAVIMKLAKNINKAIKETIDNDDTLSVLVITGVLESIKCYYLNETFALFHNSPKQQG